MAAAAENAAAVFLRGALSYERLCLVMIAFGK